MWEFGGVLIDYDKWKFCFSVGLEIRVFLCELEGVCGVIMII